MNNWNCLRLRRFSGTAHRKDRKTSSAVPTVDTSTTRRATLPLPLTMLGPCPSSPSSPPYYPSACGSTQDHLLPPANRQIGDRSSDTYIPLDECYSGARPVTHYTQSANASPQVRTRAVQSQRKASTLGSDVFLLDVVPPSPYRAADVVHSRSQSSDQHGAVSDRDTVRLSPPPQPGLVRDRAAVMMLGDSACPTLPARRPMTPQSPPPPPPSTSNSLSSDLFQSGVANAAFIHPDPVRVEHAAVASSRRVYRPSIGHRTPQSPVYAAATSNGVGRSPVIPRRRDVDVDSGRRSVTGSRPRDDEYVQSHHPPPPPPAAPAAGATPTGRQNCSVLVDGCVSHRAGLHGPLSLSTGVLNFSPPAPHLTPNQVKLHRYINAGAVSVVQLPTGHHGITTAVPLTPVVASTSSTLPIARCRGAAPLRPVEPYYNDIASPVLSPTRRLDYCNASECNDHISHAPDGRTAGFTDRIPLPIKKYDNFKDLDSSTDDDNDSGADWHSSHSAYSSVTSLDQFVAPMTSTTTQSNDVINYLTLDLDQPVDAPSSDHNREEVDSVQRPSCQRLVGANATVYGDIDWFRTHALNDMRRQVETNRKNSCGSGCLVAISK